jgi:signal peptidase
MAKWAKGRKITDKASGGYDAEPKAHDDNAAMDDDGGEMKSGGEARKKGKKVKNGWFRSKDKEEVQEEEGEEEGEEEEEEPVKYSYPMWIAIVLLFLGILFLIVLGLWMGNQGLAVVGLICMLVGIPLFVLEYRKMDAEGKKSVKRSAILLARDVAIAFLIVGIIMGAIMAYSQIWPPMVVIESESMQHSDTQSFIGTIDTGDLVLVKKSPSKSDVVTYVEGRARGYETYGDYGDVIVFRKYGAPPPATPIIHRPMVYLEWNYTTDSSFDIPGMKGLEINKDWGAVNADGNPATSYYNLTGYVWIEDVGYTNKNLTITLQNFILSFKTSDERADVYLTAGDHNLQHTNSPDPWHVKQEWIIGVARGELPWFGLIKLMLNPEGGNCCSSGWGDPAAPKNSWDGLLISLVLIITIPIVLDFVIGFISDMRAKKKKDKKLEKKKEIEDEKGKEERLKKKNKKPRKGKRIRD